MASGLSSLSPSSANSHPANVFEPHPASSASFSNFAQSPLLNSRSTERGQHPLFTAADDPDLATLPGADVAETVASRLLPFNSAPRVAAAEIDPDQDLSPAIAEPASRSASAAGLKRRRGDESSSVDQPASKAAKTEEDESDSKEANSVDSPASEESDASLGAWGWCNGDDDLTKLIELAKEAKKGGEGAQEVRLRLDAALAYVDFSALEFDEIWSTLKSYVEWKGKRHDFKRDSVYQIIMGNLWSLFPVKTLKHIFDFSTDPGKLALKSWSFPSAKDALDWSIPGDDAFNAFLEQNPSPLEEPYQSIWLILTILPDAPSPESRTRSLEQLGTFFALAIEAGREAAFWKLYQVMVQKYCLQAFEKSKNQSFDKFAEKIEGMNSMIRIIDKIKPLGIQFY